MQFTDSSEIVYDGSLFGLMLDKDTMVKEYYSLASSTSLELAYKTVFEKVIDVLASTFKWKEVIVQIGDEDETHTFLIDRNHYKGVEILKSLTTLRDNAVDRIHVRMIAIAVM